MTTAKAVPLAPGRLHGQMKSFVQLQQSVQIEERHKVLAEANTVASLNEQSGVACHAT